MGNPARPLIINSNQRRRLKELQSLPPGFRDTVVFRASIVLDAAEGLSNTQLAKKLKISRPTVIRWRKRFEEVGIDGVMEPYERPGRKKKITSEQIQAIRDAVESGSKNGIPWSTRTLAQAIGVSHSTVFRVWQSAGVQAHRLVEYRVRDIVGLHVNAGGPAVAFTVDPKLKSSGLVSLKPRITRQEENARIYYALIRERLAAALGKLVSLNYGESQPGAESVLDFLEELDYNTSNCQEVHVIAEGHGIIETPAVKAWFKVHRRYHVHLVPAGVDWKTFVLRWLEVLSPEGMKRRSFVNLAALTLHIENCSAPETTSPIVWIVPRHSPGRRRNPWAPFSMGGVTKAGAGITLFDLVRAFEQLLQRAMQHPKLQASLSQLLADFVQAAQASRARALPPPAVRRPRPLGTSRNSG